MHHLSSKVPTTASRKCSETIRNRRDRQDHAVAELALRKADPVGRRKLAFGLVS
ncbi:hypothetical protein [Rhizobium lentis]|uniref:hypothetical protein n=1 Tax=Rhizobium lentis TaxID=1138194 RepID=UPI0038621A32